MIKFNIKLEASDIKEFINITSNLDCDVDLVKGRYIVDAKSVMGVFALDLSSPVELVIHSDDKSLEDPFLKWLVL